MSEHSSSESGDQIRKQRVTQTEQLVMICGLIALVICGISFGNRWILRVVYGSVEEQVMAYAVEYFFITSLSFRFLESTMRGAALFGLWKLKYFNGYFHRDECAEHHQKYLFLFSGFDMKSSQT